ncbi:MAG: shikimate kinase, partial [Candidatus Lokiarchaeota archaeon]|nr:shikimate kinase [Candidatus Lokiarchaeota archaeon]
VLNKINIDYIKQDFHIVLLIATPEEILKRIMKEGEKKRPLLDRPDPMKEIKVLLKFRSSFYGAHAIFTVDTTSKSIDEIVSEIIIKIGI